MRATARSLMRTGTLAVLLVQVPEAVVRGQPVDVTRLDGNWVRHVSNHNPNDQMRIAISNGSAVLVRVPATVHRSFRVGQRLWMSIAADASLQVLGSDGRYYPARLTLKGSDELHVAVQQAAAGDNQVWKRAGPSVDGDWVAITPGDPSTDGTRVFAEQDQGTVRFLPAAAGRHLRIGSRIWQGISAAGNLEILTAGTRYDRACLTLTGADSLWIVPAGAGAPQLWVRPAVVVQARSGASNGAAPARHAASGACPKGRVPPAPPPS